MNYKPLAIDSNDTVIKTISSCGSHNVALYYYSDTQLILGIQYTFEKWNLRNNMLFDKNQCYFPQGQYLHWADDSH